MRRKRILATLPDGRVIVISPSPGLVMEFHLYGRATGSLSWRGDVEDRPGAAMTLADAEDAAVQFNMQFLPVGVTAVRVEWAENTADFAGTAGLKWDDGSILGRRFRDCFRRVGDALPRIDPPRARAERMAEVRRERDERLMASDVDMLRAQETNDVMRQGALNRYRQALRDLPTQSQALLDACATPEDIHRWKPSWPELPTN